MSVVPDIMKKENEYEEEARKREREREKTEPSQAETKGSSIKLGKLGETAM